MKSTKVKQFLRDQIAKESKILFGINSIELINQVTENWFNDQENYDGRWSIIQEKIPHIGKILDMAAGCGTFVLYGLHKGYNVWGVEPEAWKLNYFSQK
ncbi:hypothetical protein IQ218_16905 [Synechocystis salina LEGE 06099]|uniref:hypothetical protein n=1 Tax=Synechocystis salina TaxID=945780 RepID=UPI00187FE496|nr:hypothetical protein [Synechocystis salina]MBE9204803.1 hypothetical protein [Synechocystis salina LEGE 06099]